MKTLEQLQKEARDLSERLNELEKKEELSEEEFEEFRSKTDELSEKLDQIETREKKQNIDQRLNPEGGTPGIIINDDDDKQDRDDGDNDTEFRNFGEFFGTAMENRGDSRLAEYREMAMDAGIDGGILIPEQFTQQIMKFGPNDAVVRPKATVLPAGEYPDAKISAPTLKQGASGVTAGVQVYWGDEEPSESDTPQFGNTSLKPVKYSAYATIKNDLMRNTTVASSTLKMLFRQAIAQSEDTKFLKGDGANGPKGILNSDCLVGVTRNTSSSIKYEDLNNMETRMVEEALDGAVWVINRGALNDIKNMVDSSGNTVYDPGNRPQGIPESLDGYPIIWTRRVPSVGSEGDIMLANFSYYWVKDGSGLFIASSEHAEFKKDNTVVKVVGHVDGQSWVSEKLEAEDGTKVSPFVTLEA